MFQILKGIVEMIVVGDGVSKTESTGGQGAAAVRGAEHRNHFISIADTGQGVCNSDGRENHQGAHQMVNALV